MRSATGQASLEYTGVVALVLVLVAMAVPVASHPPLAQAVAAGIKRGICVVTAGICSARQAKAQRLEPCTLREDSKGESNGTRVALFKVGNTHFWILAQRSDGSVVLTRVSETDLGAGLHAELLGLDLGGTFSGGLHDRDVWEFADLEAARRFVIATNARQKNLKPPTFRYESLSGRTAGGVPGADLDMGVALGRRYGKGLDTVFLRTRIHDAEPFAHLVPELAGLTRWQDLTVEYSRDAAGRPREIAFHLSGRGAKRDTVVRATGRLDLRDQANARAAQALLTLRAPWPPHVIAGLKAAVGRTLEAGTVEAQLMEVKTSSKGFDASLPIIKALGLSHFEHRVSARLLAARAWVGGIAREREDCTAA